MNDHTLFMKCAINEAEKALALDEVPIGAVVVKDGQVVGRGYNLKETLPDPTAHAEIIAIKNASDNLKKWRLNDCILYSTVEPCPMCAGAIIQARIPLLVYGVRDAKAGAIKSVLDIGTNTSFNHTFEVVEGIMEEECKVLLQQFFQKLRNRSLRRDG